MQFRSSLRFIVAATLVLGLAGLAWASAHEDYMRGMTAFKSLLGDEKKGGLRSEWERVLANFEKSLAAAPKGEDAPKCMYFVGRVHEELGRRSFLKSDRDNALAAFDRMIAAYPNHEWTDDSAYRLGLIWKEQAKDPAKAKDAFERIVARYPKGDMVADARKQLAGLGGPSQAEVQAAPTPTASSAVTANPAQGGKKALNAKLMGIRCWPSQGYTRVVLDLDKDAPFEGSVVEQSGDKRQLVLSLPSAVVAPSVTPSRGVEGGFLSHIQADSSAAGGARVTLDLRQMDHYRAFTLPDPYRIVVDVFGTKQKKTASAESKASAATAQVEVASSPSRSGQAETGSKDAVDAALRDLQRKEAAAPPAAKADKSAVKAASAARDTEKKPATQQLTLNSKHKKYAGSLVEQLGLTVRTVMIDPGHGGKDPGAMANGVREKDINLRMAKILGRMLQGQGFEVHYTRTTDAFISLEERTARANAKDADLFISVHCNAYSDASIKGLEIYYLNLATDAQSVRVAARENGVSAKKISDMQFILSDLMLNSKINESRDMASLMQKETVGGMRSRYSVRNLGSKGAFFYVLTGARMPSVLVELGYLTNSAEAGNLNSDAYLTAMAKGMVGGVVAYKKKLERYASAGGGKS
jgi:N-acetylmuramoyl-L-alanine amidase